MFGKNSQFKRDADACRTAYRTDRVDAIGREQQGAPAEAFRSTSSAFARSVPCDAVSRLRDPVESAVLWSWNMWNGATC